MSYNNRFNSKNRKGFGFKTIMSLYFVVFFGRFLFRRDHINRQKCVLLVIIQNVLKNYIRAKYLSLNTECSIFFERFILISNEGGKCQIF